MRGARSRAPLLVCVVMVAASAAAQVEIDLVPPFVEKTARPGSTVRDAIVFRNRGGTNLEVSVETVDFEVGVDGRILERPPGTRTDSLVPFLRVTPSQATVSAGQELAFRWEATAPEDLTQRRVMVFFRAEPEVARSDAAQVVLVPRLGVPVYVESIDADPAELQIAAIEIARVAELDDHILLVLDVTNRGQRNIRPTGEVRVRSADGEAIAFPVNDGRDAVVPGARRRFVRDYGPVPGGELSVEVVFDVSPRERHRERLVVPAASSPSASPAS